MKLVTAVVLIILSQIAPASAAVAPAAGVSLVAPFDGETVGVGMPIIVHFTEPVADKAGMAAALHVSATRRAAGAWHWFGDSDVVYRTRRYWPAHTTVRLTGDGLDLRFRIGDSHISVADARRHVETVAFNGHIIRRLPISLGRATSGPYTTRSGIHLTMDKEHYIVFDSATVGCPPGCPDYYKTGVYNAVRISGSGEYEHGAPWAAAEIGRRNISHGCVDLRPADAAWFFGHAQRGDVVRVAGTNRRLGPLNGWGYWQLSWPQWIR